MLVIIFDGWFRRIKYSKKYLFFLRYYIFVVLNTLRNFFAILWNARSNEREYDKKTDKCGIF